MLSPEGPAKMVLLNKGTVGQGAPDRVRRGALQGVSQAPWGPVTQTVTPHGHVLFLPRHNQRRAPAARLQSLTIAMVLMFTAVSSCAFAQEQADTKQQCAQAITQLGQMCLLYAEEHGGKLPETLSTLYYQVYVEDLAAFACPGSSVKIEGRTEIDEKAGHVFVKGAGDQDPKPILQDRSADNHGGEGIHVFYSDGSVRWQPAGDTGVVTGDQGTSGGTGGTGTSELKLKPDVHLSDMEPVSIRQGAWGRIQFDKSITGGKLGIGKTQFERGVGAHSTSEIAYDIAEHDFAQFVAYVGIDQAAVAPHGTCVFKVLVDGVEEFDSGVVKNGDAPMPVSVDVLGARELKLVVTDAGDGPHYDQANWAGAGFTRAAGPDIGRGTGDTQTTTAVTERITEILTPVGGEVYFGVGAEKWESDDADLPISNGLRIGEVQSGGVAAWWGLKPGDIVLSIGASLMYDTRFAQAVVDCAPGARIPVLHLRDGEPRVDYVTVGDLPIILQRIVPEWVQIIAADTPDAESPITGAFLCAGLGDEGEPIDPGVRFPASAREVVCCIPYQDAPPGSLVLVDWYLDDESVAANLGVIDGSGTLVARLVPRGDGFEPGLYHVVVSTQGGVDANESFLLE